MQGFVRSAFRANIKWMLWQMAKIPKYCPLGIRAGMWQNDAVHCRRQLKPSASQAVAMIKDFKALVYISDAFAAADSKLTSVLETPKTRQLFENLECVIMQWQACSSALQA